MKLIRVGDVIINISELDFISLKKNKISVKLKHIVPIIDVEFRDLSDEAKNAFEILAAQLIEQDKKPEADLQSHAADSLRYATACDSDKNKFDLDIMQHNIESSRGNIQGLELANNILANRIDALEKAQDRDQPLANFAEALKAMHADINKNVGILKDELEQAIKLWQNGIEAEIANIKKDTSSHADMINVLRYDFSKTISDVQQVLGYKIANIQSEIVALNPGVNFDE